MKKIIFYQSHFCQIGGVETMAYNWCWWLRNFFDITVLYCSGDTTRLNKMKKLALTIAIILGMTMTSFADGGLFNRASNAKNGASGYTYFSGNRLEGDGIITPALPQHNQPGDQDADAPLGTGIALLTVLGGAYLVGKKRKED